MPSGRWSFVFTDQKGRPDRPIRVFTYRPKQCDTTCPIVIVLHGAKRDAYPYMKDWGSIADERKVIVIGPQFEARHWPKAAGYNAGDVKEQPDREKWVFGAIERIFDEVRDGQKDYVLFGHGAGRSSCSAWRSTVPTTAPVMSRPTPAGTRCRVAQGEGQGQERLFKIRIRIRWSSRRRASPSSGPGCRSGSC